MREETRNLSERVVRIEEQMNTQREQVRRERAESTLGTLKWLVPVILSTIAIVVSILVGTGVV